jgi:hypothetical protein
MDNAHAYSSCSSVSVYGEHCAFCPVKHLIAVMYVPIMVNSLVVTQFTCRLRNAHRVLPPWFCPVRANLLLLKLQL